jgi:hypothetical protein
MVVVDAGIDDGDIPAPGVSIFVGHLRVYAIDSPRERFSTATAATPGRSRRNLQSSVTFDVPDVGTLTERLAGLFGKDSHHGLTDGSEVDHARDGLRSCLRRFDGVPVAGTDDVSGWTLCLRATRCEGTESTRRDSFENSSP